MSQEKVTKYKEQKANRKSIMKKQKAAKYIRNSIVFLVFAATVFWIGSSAVKTYKANQPREAVEVDYTSLDSYIGGIGVQE